VEGDSFWGGEREREGKSSLLNVEVGLHRRKFLAWKRKKILSKKKGGGKEKKTPLLPLAVERGSECLPLRKALIYHTRKRGRKGKRKKVGFFNTLCLAGGGGETVRRPAFWGKEREA